MPRATANASIRKLEAQLAKLRRRGTAGSTGGGGIDQGHRDDTTGAHSASSIAFTPTVDIAATTVQAAIEEVRAEAGGSGGDVDGGLPDSVFTTSSIDGGAP